MKTRDELRKRFRAHLAGLALFGCASDAKDNVLQRASFALDIPAEVDRVLDQIYDYMTRDDAPLPVRPGANGAARQKA